MRRILTPALACSLLALALPAAASAHHGSRHRHHSRHHAHTVVFVRHAKPSSTTTPGTGTPTSEQVATVASFEGGVLKITLAGGSTVSGKVTENTEIECGSDGHHFEDGPQGAGHDDNGDDDDAPGSFHHDDEQGQQGEGSCGVSSLVAGAKVEEAELHVSGAGAFWEKVELIPQS